MRSLFVSALLSGFLGLLTCSQADAYGAVSRSGSYTNPNTGRSVSYSGGAAVGPGGVARGGTATVSGPNGSETVSGARAYSPAMYGGYSAGGHVSATGPYGSYSGGVYRTYP
jgi:hypothetical protein